MLTTTGSLESKTIHELQLQCLWDLASIHIISVISDTTRGKLLLIPRPLVCDQITTAHTPDRNNHLGTPSGMAVEINFILCFAAANADCVKWFLLRLCLGLAFVWSIKEDTS